MRRIWAFLTARAKDERGFTLIELLVVLVILATLAALALPRVAMTRTTAESTVSNANRAILQSAVERYHVEVGAWPTTGGGAGSLLPGALIPDYLAKDLTPNGVSTYEVTADGLLTP